MSNMDRFTIHSQLQHLQSKYPGTGNADTTRLEWGLNIQRDTLASHVGHYSREGWLVLNIMGSALHACVLLQQMVNPTGVTETPSGAATVGAEGASKESEIEQDADAAKDIDGGKDEVTKTKEEKEEDEDVAMDEGDDI
ncbi:splicing factor 3b subunit [Cyclospora cayetanensis]|uniref:Splicing factor 3b subunit n=1 Tax=Cyclospora cayetanensis TaxID=88456 RepID=A0A1D3D6W1_9EIME|nr:splicing factor 3b subunit [Cyclospora cayetanensis]